MSLKFEYSHQIRKDQKCCLGGTPEACLPCPSLSSSQGGMVRVCPCLEGTRRVNDSDPSLPCVGELLKMLF